MGRFWRLHNLILAGIVLGIFAGVLLEGRKPGDFFFDLFDALGAVFLNLLKAVMVPLVLVSLLVGMVSVGDPRKLGRMGIKSLLYFVVTTMLAIAIGLVLVNLLKPGEKVTKEARAKLEQEYQKAAEIRARDVRRVQQEWNVWAFLKSLVPANLFRSMAADPPEMLPIIVFALLLGLAATLVPEANQRPLVTTLSSLNDAILKLVTLIMYVAPLGAFALIARVIMSTGLGILLTLGAYCGTILLALMAHFGLTYSATVWLSARLSPLKFWKAMREAFLTAFSTSSSAATLPVNLKCVQQNLGVPKQVSSFVLPLGATINMDGTVIFQGVASVFIAQIYGLDLSLGQQLTILATATFASIGTAPVPGAGIVMLGMIMAPLNIPLEGIALILGVDRFLDMCRTVVNITGDAACAVMVAATEGEPVGGREASNLGGPSGV